jgi:SSS family solute:Na+ symporter
MTAALIIYLIVLVLIAIRSARKVKDIPDFFVARKGASARMVAGSLVATILGGSAVIGAIDSGMKIGGAASWFMLTGALGLFALIPFAGRAYSHGKYTLPDLVENLYGKGPRFVASLVIPVAWTGIVAAQIIAAAKLLMTFTPMEYTTAAVVSAAVFTGYTLAGGQLSILRTDFLQACLIIAGLLLIAGFALINGAGDAGVLPGKDLPFPFNAGFSPFDLFLLILTYGTTYTAGPDIFSRVFCAKDTATAKKGIAIAACVLIPVAFVIGILALFGTSLGDVQGARITAIANAVLPPALVPLVALALLSVVLSSADTTLLSSSVILCGLFRTGASPKEAHDPHTAAGLANKTLLKARVVIFLNGIVALLLALVFTDIIGTLLLALAVYAGAFTVPILWGLAGLRSRPASVAAGIILGGALALAGKLCPPLPGTIGSHTGDILTIAAFIVNGICLAAGRLRRKSA